MRKRKNLIWKLALKILEAKVSVAPRYQLSANAREEVKRIVESGDILLDCNSAFPCSQLFAGIFFGTRWIHSAMYVGNGSVIDSGRKSHVAEFSLDDFLETTDAAVFRPAYVDQGDRDAAVAFVRKAVGKPFNITFDDKNGKAYYCTQLIADALDSMPHPICLPRRHLLWKKVIPPAAVEVCSQIDCVWSSHPSLFKNVRCHTPILVGAVTGGVAALVLTGSNIWAGAIAGCLLTSSLMQTAMVPDRRSNIQE